MQIEQIDRDAAAEEVYEREKGNLAWPYARSTCDRILSGDWDHHPTVQRYARHRLAALSARPAVGEDVVERVARAISDYTFATIHGSTDCNEWEDMTATDRFVYRNAAHAAIAAMGGE